jgi:hypothetical protein
LYALPVSTYPFGMTPCILSREIKIKIKIFNDRSSDRIMSAPFLCNYCCGVTISKTAFQRWLEALFRSFQYVSLSMVGGGVVASGFVLVCIRRSFATLSKPLLQEVLLKRCCFPTLIVAVIEGGPKDLRYPIEQANIGERPAQPMIPW